MDPELMALLAQARTSGANKNMSSVLRNLGSPFLAFLAGVPQQQDMSMADMPLTSAYAGSQDPVVQSVLNQVNTGIDEYALKSWLANQDANPEFAQLRAEYGWQPEDLEGLAVGLQKERSKAGGRSKDSWWAKAGLSDPSQMYTEETVPLSEADALRIADVRMGSSPARQMLSRANIDVANARRGVELSKKTLSNFLKNLRGVEMQGGGTQSAMALTRLRKDLSGLEGGITEQGFEQLVQKYRPENEDYAKMYEEDIDRLYKKGKPSAPGRAKDALVVAQERQGLAAQQMNAAAEEESAIRRGRARAFAEAGRTPTRDQLASIMRFMTGK